MKTKTKVTAVFYGAYFAIVALLSLLLLNNGVSGFWFSNFVFLFSTSFALVNWSRNRYVKKRQNHCMKCGAENPHESIFCQTCGKKLDS